MTTQVGNGQGLGTTFTAGAQLDSSSDNGIGGFVAGGVNNGDPNSLSPGLQTGFGFSGQGGQTVATAQLGGNVQAPQLAGVNFNRPNNAFGVQVNTRLVQQSSDWLIVYFIPSSDWLTR